MRPRYGRTDQKANHDISYSILHNPLTARAPARPEYMVHTRFRQLFYKYPASTELYYVHTASPPGRFDRGYGPRPLRNLAANRQDLGGNETARRDVRWIWPQGHSSDKTLGDYCDRPRGLGSRELGRPNSGVVVNGTRQNNGCRRRAEKQCLVEVCDLPGA